MADQEVIPGLPSPEPEVQAAKAATAAPSRHKEDRPNLRVLHGGDNSVVDTDTGEVHEVCKSCVEFELQLDGAEREIKAWRTRYGHLKADKEAEAKGHQFFPRAIRLFDIWREETGHLDAKWTTDRFWMCLPTLKNYDDDDIERAIAGIAYDPYTNPKRNGGLERYDSWETLFKVSTNIQTYAAKAPPKYPGPMRWNAATQAKEIATFILDRARLIEETNDSVALARLLVEIDRRNRQWLDSAL